MKQPKDTSWPPLGVKDLKPDGNTKPEVVKFGTMADALKGKKL